jgi:prephenate dehydrogenase
MRFSQVTIVGIGLIGGSFAKAIRKLNLAERITGWDGPEQLDAARGAGLIDGVEDSFGTGDRCEADLVYLASPVCSIISFLRSQGKSLRPGAIVTDAGSTKREVCRAAEEALPSGIHFVGGHPMAGSHDSGLAFAREDLFSGAPYAVVPSGNSSTQAVNCIVELARALGAMPQIMAPGDHDRAVALGSHVPQLLSTALALSVVSAAESEGVTLLAGKGFSDSIRLAASRWSVWSDICRTNPDEIDLALGRVIGEIESLRNKIKTRDFESLGESFKAGSVFAESFLNARTAGPHPTSDEG